jgi:hypothetical protein
VSYRAAGNVGRVREGAGPGRGVRIDTDVFALGAFLNQVHVEVQTGEALSVVGDEVVSLEGFAEGVDSERDGLALIEGVVLVLARQRSVVAGVPQRVGEAGPEGDAIRVSRADGDVVRVLAAPTRRSGCPYLTR